jgi:hypothetical protein
MSEVCIESVTSQFHKMLELPVIRSGPPEDCDVGNRRLNLGEVLAVLSDECNDALNGRMDGSHMSSKIMWPPMEHSSPLTVKSVSAKSNR